MEYFKTVKKITSVSLAIFISLQLSAYDDLGTYGKLYEIKEQNLMAFLEKKSNETDKEALKNTINKKYEETFIVASDIQHCKESRQRIFEPVTIVQEDIIVPHTDVLLYKKGYRYNILRENNVNLGRYLVFIDADDKNQVNFARYLQNRADIIVINGDFKNLIAENIEVKIGRDNIENKAFELNCVPSVYAQDNNYNMVVYEYNPQELFESQNKDNQ